METTKLNRHVLLTWNALGKYDNIMENSGGFRLNNAINTT